MCSRGKYAEMSSIFQMFPGIVRGNNIKMFFAFVTGGGQGGGWYMGKCPRGYDIKDA